MHARKLLWGLALVRLILPFLLQHAYYQPHRDEFLYLDYAKHMDWGYMEVPPLLSVFSWLTFNSEILFLGQILASAVWGNHVFVYR
jgi:hypothetical protein